MIKAERIVNLDEIMAELKKVSKLDCPVLDALDFPDTKAKLEKVQNETNGEIRYGGFFKPDVGILIPGINHDRNVELIVILHEFGHLVHWARDRKYFDESTKYEKESYAYKKAVQIAQILGGRELAQLLVDEMIYNERRIKASGRSEETKGYEPLKVAIAWVCARYNLNNRARR